MNQELRLAYHALEPNQREALKQEFANSPKALLLLAFLDEFKNKDFTNQQVIPHVYGNDAGTFDVHRNRYFKLRKTLLSSIQNAQRHINAEAGFPFPQEQGDLYHIKTLIRQDGQYGLAKQKLETLIKRGWAENLFELLPDAIQSLIYCRHVLGEYHQNEKLYADWELATVLLKDMSQVRLLSSRALNAFHEAGIEPVLETMLLMKRIVQKWKAYPRFALAYHLSHILNGTATMGNTVGALTRHINAYEQLRLAHPTMPGIAYETNHLWVERFRYLYSKGLYSYIKEDYQQFYKSQVEAYQLTGTIPELKGARSEAMFTNKIRTETLLGYYTEATKTAQEMQEFQKAHQLTANLWKTLLELGRMYVYSYPKTAPANLGTFITTLQRNISTAQAAMGPNERGEAMGVVAILRFYNQEYALALKTYEQPDTKAFFEAMGIGAFYQVFQLPFNPQPNIPALHKDIKNQAYQTDNPPLRNLLLKALGMIALYTNANAI